MAASLEVATQQMGYTPSTRYRDGPNGPQHSPDPPSPGHSPSELYPSPQRSLQPNSRRTSDAGLHTPVYSPNDVSPTPPDEPGPSNWASQRLASLTLAPASQASSPSNSGYHENGNGMQVDEGMEERPPARSTAVLSGKEDHRLFQDGRIGVLPPEGTRSYSAIKLVGDGSFGTVWLCDWGSTLSSTTMLSAMQCGAGARAEWAGKRLVAVKRMKRVWEGGWKQASALGELVSLKDIPSHPAIIPLYDAFLEPETKELYFVFECMEGNLYQLTKSRKGRPLAAGLIASIFHQVAGGLRHIHRSGYFHRDMKPENLLVTTTGLQDYMPVVDPESLMYDQMLRNANKTPPERAAPRIEKDVTVIVKLADFGLARALSSSPPYTEYVSTRWYRAPEVLLRSREYSAPVDMWAFGTIMAELVNLKALFPGQSEVDQVYRICETLGDPSRDYGKDERGQLRGGGDWDRGIKMAKAVGFAFPKKIPVNFAGLFSPNVPLSLIDCIAALLRYNPKYRLTSDECFEQPYYRLTLPHLKASTMLPQIPFSSGQPAVSDLTNILKEMERKRMQDSFGALQVTSPRPLPPSHSASPVENKPAFGREQTGPRPMFPGASPSHSPVPSLEPAAQLDARASKSMAAASALMDQLRELDLPTEDLASYGHRPPPSPNQTPSHRFSMDAVSPGGQQHQHQQQQHHAPSRRHPESYLPPHMSTPTALASSHDGTPPMDRSHMAPPPRRVSRTDERLDSVAEDVEMMDSKSPPLPSSQSMGKASGLGSGLSSVSLPAKKKKWGLSSVFGNNDSKVDQTLVNPPPAAASTSSLKRTQSGTTAVERQMEQAAALAAAQKAAGMDPKKAKKEAEKAARELEKAKREAAERAQKERARAVMQKRNRLVEERRATGSKGELEWSADLARIDRRNEIGYQPERSSASSNTTLGAHSNVDLHNPTYQDAVRSASKLSLGSAGSHELSEQAVQALAHRHARESSNGGMRDRESQDQARRAKARRREHDGDHSTSSLDLRMLPNHSVLSVGTVDSDPGPARSPRAYPYMSSYPRASSATSLGAQSARLRSNASLDRQLARDFQARATVTKPSSPPYGSASSLSHYNTSSTSVSGPSTPYGNPLGTAVANGIGLGRNGAHPLPSIADWDMQSEGSGYIRGSEVDASAFLQAVPPTNQKITLPPFAEIASVADSHLPKRG